jgi:hypothetical protein
MPLSFSLAEGVGMTGRRRFPVSLGQANDQAYGSINHSEPRLIVLSGSTVLAVLTRALPLDAQLERQTAAGRELTELG